MKNDEFHMNNEKAGVPRSGQRPPKPMVIIGAGQYGTVIAELAEQCGYRIELFLDDSANKHGGCLDGTSISVPVADHLRSISDDTSVAVALGNNEARLRWLHEAKRLGYRTPSLISPRATVSPTAIIEEAVYLHSQSHIWSKVHVGFGSIISPNSTVGHHTVLGKGCFVASGADLGGAISVGDEAFFGLGSVTSTGVKNIATGTTVGAGAVIIRDTAARGVYVGSPGRRINNLES